jgi:S1-C subfamily serine protease
MQDYGGYGYGGYGYPPPPQPPRGPGLWRYLAVAVAAGAIGAGAVLAVGHINFSSASDGSGGNGSAIGAAPTPAASGAAPQQQLPAQQPAGSDGLSAADQAIYNKVEPGLVIIDDQLNYQSEEAAGTGMVLNSSGLVLTNNHVIENATSISATVLATGKTYKVKVLGYDKTGDVAAIQLEDASGLRTVPLGNSSDVKTGDSVLAMGNAEGQSQIVPAPGQVTGINQTITASDDSGTDTSETLHGMIETNADVVSGDSGGGLANMSGQVIGMDTAGNDVSYGYQQATGFAIPINTALSIVDQIVAGQGSSTITVGYPPFMGIFITGTSSDPKDQQQEGEQGTGGSDGSGIGGFGSGNGNGGGNGQQSCYDNNADLPVPSTIAPATTGTLIIGTICGGPADAAGLTAGDVITAINGQSVGSPQDLESIVAKFKSGDTISVTWQNTSGRTTTTSIHLIDGPPD